MKNPFIKFSVIKSNSLYFNLNFIDPPPDISPKQLNIYNLMFFVTKFLFWAWFYNNNAFYGV